MGQQEVYEILKKNKNKWISVKDIKEVYKSSTIRCTLLKMFNSNQVERKQLMSKDRIGINIPLKYYVYRLKDE